MEAFFKKFPMEFKEKTAIKMIHKKIESAQEKCGKEDEDYIKDLSLAYHMLEAFFNEKGINPAMYV